MRHVCQGQLTVRRCRRQREFREGPLDRDDLGLQALERVFGALLRHLLELFYRQSTTPRGIGIPFVGRS